MVGAVENGEICGLDILTNFLNPAAPFFVGNDFQHACYYYSILPVEN